MAATLTFDILAKDRASRTFTTVGTAAQKTSTKFSHLKTVAAGLGVAGAALAVKFGKDSVKAFTDAQAAQARLSDAFQRFPRLADSNIQSFRALNQQLAAKTRFDDDALASGQAVLAQFKLTGKQVESLTPLLADYAAKTGKDLPTAATTLGKAFLGNTRALKELGISYQSTGNAARDVANITDLVRQKVGGFAAKEGKTAAGQAAILRNQFGELQEAIGSKLVPVLLRLTKVGLNVVAFFQKYSDVLAPLTAGILAFVVATKAAAVAQVALNVAVRANPYVLAATAIIGLGVAAVVAYKRFKVFRDVVSGVAKQVANNFLTAIGVVLSTTASMVKVFARLPGPLGAPWRAMRAEVINATVAVHNLQGAINAVHSKTVSVTVQTNFIGGRSGGRGGGRRQHGGPVTAGMPYIVGERQPELFVPSQSGKILPSVPTGPMDLSDKTIRKLGEVIGRTMLAGIGAANTQSARQAGLYARAG